MDVNMTRMREIELIDEACCQPFLSTPLDEESAGRLASALKVLADPTRLRLVSLIAAQDPAEACVCNLTDPLGLSQPTVSHHLKVLSEAGIVEREQRGRWAFFRLRPETLQLLSGAFEAPARRRTKVLA
jgi:ArsR family transcriptional regulator, arsenate/arsenite/antimonite-responsive transcriptional repressor